MKIKGITKSWFFNVFGIIFIFLVAFEIIFSIIMTTYYYDSVRQRVKTTATVTAQFFNKYSKNQSSEFYSAAIKLADDFTEKDKMELQIVDIDGKVLASTNGYLPSEPIGTSDFTRAMWQETPSFLGKNTETKENIMAVSVGLKDASGNIRAIARFVVSTAKLEYYLLFIIGVSIIICFIILLLVFFSGSYYIGSIVKPVAQITEATKTIAKGDLKVRIENSYNNEIGELVESINNMAEELCLTEQIKNDFISSISHELRTPLTAIKGWSETMLSCDVATEAVTIDHGLKVINDEAERLTKMVEELLDFSRMQSNRLTLNMVGMDIGQILIETTYMLAERARREGIIIEYSSEGELPPMEGDPDRLKQVFINIIDNAVKHSEKEGNIIIQSSCAGEKITVIIKDFGIGIPQDFLPKAKEKFIKGPTSKRGSGLGLALADEIIRLHNGELNLESTENVGTTVTIILPLIQPKTE